MVGVVLKGGGPAADRFVSALQIGIAAPSLGGVETLVSQPRYTSHVGLSATERDTGGVPDGFVRISVGVEDAVDLTYAGDGLLELDRVADLDHEAVLDHWMLGRALGLEDVEPRLAEGPREVLEEANAVPGVDLDLHAVGGPVVAVPADRGEAVG